MKDKLTKITPYEWSFEGGPWRRIIEGKEIGSPNQPIYIRHKDHLPQDFPEIIDDTGKKHYLRNVVMWKMYPKTGGRLELVKFWFEEDLKNAERNFEGW